MATPQPLPSDPSQASVPTLEFDDRSPAGAEGTPDKEKKRKFWPFGKKKEDKSKEKAAAIAGGGLTSDYTNQPARSASPVPASGMSAPTSPARRADGSPRIVSPASSQIFERNVQEESLAPAAVPEQIPSHIATENHIPPALDASSLAITDKRLDPDNVEIFTHIAHTPAAVTVAQGTTQAGSMSGMVPSGMLSEASTSPTLPATSEEAVASRSALPPTSVPQHLAGATATASGAEEGASSYGALDSTDVRRLSFISFADVVHAEQAQSIGSETSSHLASQANLQPNPSGPSVPMQPLSPALSSASPKVSSPLRATSPARGVSPARAVSPSLGASNLAASPKIVGASPSPPTGIQGELAVETMGQALRKTGSGDLGKARERDLATNQGSGEGLGLTR